MLELLVRVMGWTPVFSETAAPVRCAPQARVAQTEWLLHPRLWFVGLTRVIQWADDRVTNRVVQKSITHTTAFPQDSAKSSQRDRRPAVSCTQLHTERRREDA